MDVFHETHAYSFINSVLLLVNLSHTILIFTTTLSHFLYVKINSQIITLDLTNFET